jgi:hypothetical protein
MPGAGAGANVPTFAAGEEVVYTDSQGNRARVAVVKVCRDVRVLVGGGGRRWGGG